MEHDHCPCNCDHPQPITADGNPKSPPGAVAGHRYCGRCWVMERVLCEMVLCTPATCPGEG